jgi:hypothetical protein
MAKEVTCPPCGQTIQGESDDELVSNVISHAKAMDMRLARQIVIRFLVRPAKLRNDVES